ncbi:hypothetical protein Q31b_17480 [Novipirellula aureliae]|uniref:Beta-hexosaminidase bacterial type N-terminal domain-containing protein n=1 Tax=Novipirellula aureliae TaxID=2527966 RepID=A0A5C6E5M3_9BACT|nr:hypothetical protein [Novipirellula aureliae]TWU44212.1 hypothetical protein Q31b_17480 [Novipirellula aureliae]
MMRLFGFVVALAVCACGYGESVDVVLNTESYAQSFGGERVLSALKEKGDTGGFVDPTAAEGDEAIRVTLLPNGADKTLVEAGFSLAKTADGVEVRAIDEIGAMYGLLELADMIGIHGLESVPEKTVNPRFPFRAIKFNLPWSSYRQSEELQALHHETLRDMEFWRSFLDMMAENRFNALTLWSLHPFPYMIRPTNFPKACPFDDAELAEWQTFWRTLFKEAKLRGIDVYLVNWNIFGSEGYVDNYDPEMNKDTGAHYTQAKNSPEMERYTKECVTQVINEYPNLAGLGISLGEAMNGMEAEDREKWIFRTFVEGMKAADRKIKFIHRVPFTAQANSGGSTDRATEEMTRNAIDSLDVDGPVWVEIKFNWSHAHSTPKLIQVHGGSISDAYRNPLPENYAVTWMMRNESFYILRWGEPDFIRKHIELNGQPYVGGYYVGSECYFPGKEYTHVPDHEHVTWDYAWERQWLFYKQWGRLLYDPKTTDQVFALEFDQRYGKGVGEKMVEAFKLASKMPLRFASYVDNSWDFTMYAEGMLVTARYQKCGYDDKKSPFLSLEELMDYDVLDPAYISVLDYVQAERNGTHDEELITPLELADELQGIGEKALGIVQTVTGDHPTLECEIMDVQAWSHQCLYFAEKLRAAVALEQYRADGDKEKQAEAVATLKRAQKHWQNLVAVTKPHHQPVTTIQMRNRIFSWQGLSEEVARDIAVAETYDRTKQRKAR